MVSKDEFAWITDQTEGDYDHLLIGTSLPWLLARALHDLEAWDEALCDGRRGKRLARFGEWLRRAADLEHWAAFRKSFESLGAADRLGRPAPGRAGDDLRALRRRPPRLRRTGALPAADAVEGLPADLLAAAQLRPVRDEDRLPGLLEPASSNGTLHLLLGVVLRVPRPGVHLGDASPGRTSATSSPSSSHTRPARRGGAAQVRPEPPTRRS